MINLTIGKNIKCSIPDAWNELTITDYAKIVSLIEDYNKSEELKEFDDIKTLEMNLENIKCNREIFKYLTKLDTNTINQIDLKQMESMIQIVTNLLSNKTDYIMPDGDRRDSFKFKGKVYKFPYANMTQTKFGDYIEAEQVGVAGTKLKSGRFGSFAEQIAILCKEEGVENTEDIIKIKTKLFEKLPMDICWKFIFFLSKQTQNLKNNSLQYSKMVTDQLIDTQTRTGI